MQEPETIDLLAAMDLGSNSFHMVVARPEHGAMQVIDRLSEKVQLAAGLDERGRLDEPTQERALACLGRFAQHIRGVQPGSLRVVATNALRVARNAGPFLKKAERLLGRPIEVISGREEARLIYLGVSHTQVNRGRQLVVDIGGGSTEFIIGESHEPLLLESLHMGCVSFQRRFFADGSLQRSALKQAVLAARQQVNLIAQEYRELGWDVAIGSSGTIKAILGVLQALGWAEGREFIKHEDLDQLMDLVASFRHADEINLPGIKDDRRPLLAAGLSIAQGFFQELGIETMYYSDGALREGVLYDMMGRFNHEDVRQRTVVAMQRRYRVDVEQAARVRNTMRTLILAAQADTGFVFDEALLLQAAELHEVGLGVSHSGFHKHGAYLLQYSDMSGFSRLEQERLALLVGAHRRKIRDEQVQAMREAGGPSLLLGCFLLRLAVLMHHSRQRDPLPRWLLLFRENTVHLEFPKGWLDRNPLTLMDLQQEQEYTSALDWTLFFR